MGGNKREGDEFNDFPMIIHPHLSPPPSRGRNFRMAYLLLAELRKVLDGPCEIIVTYVWYEKIRS